MAFANIRGLRSWFFIFEAVCVVVLGALLFFIFLDILHVKDKELAVEIISQILNGFFTWNAILVFHWSTNYLIYCYKLKWRFVQPNKKHALALSEYHGAIRDYPWLQYCRPKHFTYYSKEMATGSTTNSLPPQNTESTLIMPLDDVSKEQFSDVPLESIATDSHDPKYRLKIIANFIDFNQRSLTLWFIHFLFANLHWVAQIPVTALMWGFIHDPAQRPKQALLIAVPLSCLFPLLASISYLVAKRYGQRDMPQ